MRAASDRTADFRQAVSVYSQRFPPAKRPRSQARAENGSTEQSDPWTKQAELIATNLKSFQVFLASIRRAYLDVSSSHASTSAQNKQQRTLDPSQGLQAWQGVKWLSDRERDEIDFGVKVALKKSLEGVRQLEGLEQVRQAHERKQQSGLSRMLGLQPGYQTSAQTSHRTYITLYLNHLLAAVSNAQREQQEARVARTLEKNATLATTVEGLDEQVRLAVEASKRERAKGKGRDSIVPDMFKPVPIPSARSGADGDEDVNDDPLAASGLSTDLTEDQLQQFENETSSLLRATQSDLEAIKAAESSLLEIASLQSQLATHLTQQQELTDKLWDDAITVSGKTREANAQLEQAKKRNKGSRLFILFFLIMASFSLVFLDYYSS